LKEISPNQTAVTWGITGKSPYPWNLMNLFMNMNKDFDQGLNNLKNVLKVTRKPWHKKKVFSAHLNVR
jgi:hypothetical protein